MSGRILAILIVAAAGIGGAAMYYLQVYAYYETVAPDPGRDVVLVPQGATAPEAIDYAGFEAIDSPSSPIRYRACFTTPLDPEELAARFVTLEGAVPRNAPAWFPCFDADGIAAALAEGSARAFLGGKNVAHGVDRIVVVGRDGRGFAWNDLNDCGKKSYDGTQVGEDCPPRDPG